MAEPYRTVLKTYAQNPLLKLRYNREFRSIDARLYRDLITIKDLTVKDYTLRELDKLYTIKDSNYYVLARLLAYMPPAKILENFGEEAVFWTWQRYNDSERNKVVLEYYAKLTGKDAKLLENSRLAEWRLYHDTNTLPKDTDSLYNILTELDNKLSKINLEEIILKFSSNKKRTSKIIDRYSLTRAITDELSNKGGGYDSRYERIDPKMLTSDKNKVHVVYMDTPIGITLMYNNKPVALTTFAFEDDVLQIHQIQGIQERVVDKNCELLKDLRTKGLFDFNWKKTLVTITEEVAKSLDIKKCSIVNSRKQRWTKEYWKDGRVHMKMKDAIRIYDYTARSLGYERNPKQENNWYKKL